MCRTKCLLSVLVTHQIWTKSAHFTHVPCEVVNNQKNEKASGRPPLLMDIGPPCAPWCTTQVGSAHCRSMVHNIVLYPWSGAQRRSHKPRQTDRQWCKRAHCALACRWAQRFKYRKRCWRLLYISDICTDPRLHCASIWPLVEGLLVHFLSFYHTLLYQLSTSIEKT